MPRRLGSISAIALAFLALFAPSAQASLWSGSCTVLVTIGFNSGIKATSLTAPGYSLTLEPAVDLNPLAAGQQACAITLDPLEPLRSTSGGGTGSSTLWTCEFALGTGSWNQSWTDSSGAPSPPSVFGASHLITGTWGAWTLVVNSPSLNFVGVAQLTTQAVENLKAPACAGAGVGSLTMIGEMVFQDP